LISLPYLAGPIRTILVAGGGDPFKKRDVIPA
jgi:hypothetical protein